MLCVLCMADLMASLLSGLHSSTPCPPCTSQIKVRIGDCEGPGASDFPELSSI